MAKINTKETVSVSRTLKVDNGSDSSRKYIIEACVRLTDGDIEVIDRGTVCALEGTRLASFNLFGEENLSVNFNTGISRIELLTEIQHFCSDVKEELGTTPQTETD